MNYIYWVLINILVYFRYLYTRYLIKWSFKSYRTIRNIPLLSIGYNGYISFFGYYNISPANIKDEVLFCAVKTNRTRGSIYEKTKICVKSGDEVKQLNLSSAWNWQQGCMLQWLPKSDGKIIFNDYSLERNQYVAIIQDISTSEKVVIDSPVYSVAKNGQFALTLNFERLALMRPDYGYFKREISWHNIPNDKSDGVWYIDLDKNLKRLIISLESLKEFLPVPSMKDAKHKVNHIDISPNGKRFMFLHRWIGPQGRFMRLLTANSFDGKELFYVTGDIMVSHNCWWGDSDIISFCRLENSLDRYVHFKDKKGFISTIGEDVFSKDGHPSVSPDGRWLLTDDYPDNSRFSHLHIYSFEKKRKITIGSFYQPLRFKKEKRIDLHPRWGPDGNTILFDSGHNGNRGLYMINIDELINS